MAGVVNMIWTWQMCNLRPSTRRQATTRASLRRNRFQYPAPAGEVLVEVAGCGSATRTSVLYDGFHVSNRVTLGMRFQESWCGIRPGSERVIVPAVMPVANAFSANRRAIAAGSEDAGNSLGLYGGFQATSLFER